MKTVQELRSAGAATLRARWDEAGPRSWSFLRDPVRDADVLLGSLLQLPSAELVLHRGREVAPEIVERFERFIDRRAGFEPVAYILGSKEFWGLELTVSPAVLIPRPETELLVERAIGELDAAISAGTPCTVIDVGTGSGAIILAVLHELRERRGQAAAAIHAIASDISGAALAVAEENAARIGLEGAVTFVNGHLLEPLAKDRPEGAGNKGLLLVLSNPPYVPDTDERPPELAFEPNGALSGGADGLRVITELVDHIERRLSQGEQVVALMEIGQHQHVALDSLLRVKSRLNWSFHRDLAQIPRVLEIRPRD